MNYVYIFLILIFGVFLPVTKPITVEKILPLVNRFFKHTSPLLEIAVTANDYLNYYDVPMTVEEEKIFMKIDNINMEINEISVQINRIGTYSCHHHQCLVEITKFRIFFR